MKYISLGNSRYVNIDDIIAIIELSAVPATTINRLTNDKVVTLDISGGRLAKTMIVMKYNYVFMSEMKADTIKNRIESFIAEGQEL